MTTFGHVILGLLILGAGGWLATGMARDIRAARPGWRPPPLPPVVSRAARRAAPAARAATSSARSAATAGRRRVAALRGAPQPAAAPVPVHAPSPAPSPAPAPATAAANVVRLDARRAPQPAASQPAPAQDPPATRSQPVTATAPPASPSAAAGGADLFAAVHVIIGHANAGGIKSKLRAAMQMSEAQRLMADALAEFSRRLAEPDMDYAPVVWEPVARSAAHVKAAAMELDESATAISAILNRPLGESAGQVPHNRELNAPE